MSRRNIKYYFFLYVECCWEFKGEIEEELRSYVEEEVFLFKIKSCVKTCMFERIINV